jgi:tetratricopeptide (TPR) repeat protein
VTEIIASDSVVVAQHIATGVAYFRLNRFADAIACFDQALRYKPDDPYARWNRATALLSIGDYARGFKEHDVAWRLFHWRGFSPVGDDIDRLTTLPLWQGERSTRVLAYHELGHGDAIMAFRFIPELKRRCGVTLVIAEPLVRLARSFGIEVTGKVPDNLSGYDFRLPFFGVMSALQQTADSIPAAPYILGIPIDGKSKFDGRRIGIAWSGRTQTGFSLQDFLTLLDGSGFQLYALQPGPTSEAVAPLRPGSDFADVADLIAEMDHVVSVDTAAIHLAGAMGHRSAHLLLPYLMDWRWHHTARWYPQLKTYRQHDAHDWTAPFAKLNEALHGTA